MYVLTLGLPMLGKARPRVTSRGTFMPQPYQQWQRTAQALLRDQWEGRSPLEAVEWITVQFRCPSGRTDLDNAIGSVLDALVQARVLRDDNATRVPAITAAWERTDIRTDITITIEESTHGQQQPRHRRRRSVRSV